MKDAILEKLKEGCGKSDNDEDSYYICEKDNYCEYCHGRIKQHKISTDAERKRILEIIDKRHNNWLNGLDSEFVKSENDMIEKNAKIEELYELKQQITQEGENKNE